MRSRQLLAFACVAFLGSCGSPELSLDEAAANERRDERSRRMAITVVDPLTGAESELTADALAAQILSGCSAAVDSDAWSAFAAAPFADGCVTDLVYVVFRSECAAHRLLSLGKSEVPASYDIGPSVNESDQYLIAPLTPEARIGVFRAAATYAQFAVTAAGDTVRYHAGQNPTGGAVSGRITSCDVGAPLPSPSTSHLMGSVLRQTFSFPDPDTGLTRDATGLGLLSASMTGALLTLEDAARSEASYQSSVAEAERSRSSSPVTAAELAWADAESIMSRTNIAKHLVGGSTVGLFGYEEGEGVCGVESPNEATQAAVDFLRSTGANPRELLDLNIPLDSLVTGGAGVSSGTLAERIGAMSGVAPPADTDEFLALGEVSFDAVQGARRYLREEARAFALPFIPIALGIPLSGEEPGSPGVQRSQSAWATTLRPPVVPDPAYYVGAVAFADVSDLAHDGNGLLNQASTAFAGRSVVNTVDFAYAVATDMATFEGASTPSGYLELPLDARRALVPLVETAATRIPARVQFCRFGTTNYVDVLHRQPGFFESNDDLLVVRGISGLQCATQGTIEGEPCELADFTLGVGSSSNSGSTTSRAAGFRQSVSASFPAPSVGAPEAGELPQEAAEREFIYALRRMDSSLEVIGVHRLGKRTNMDDLDQAYCMMMPYAPEYIDLVGELLTPSTRNCATTAATCAGPRFAELIPLENEITGDDGGQGLENSWQYWLGLAEQSARLSDELGTQMLSSGQALDVGLESVEDRLGELCGGPVDVADAFFELLAEPPGGACAIPGGTCDAGYACNDGYCVRDIDDLLSQERFRTLRECLGSETVLDYVTAGTRPLCAWELNGELCGIAPPLMGAEPVLYQACPWVAGGTSDSPTCQTPTLPPDANMLPAPITETLGIFETDDPATFEEPEGPFDCSTIRAMRQSSGAEREAYAREVAGSQNFSRGQLAEFINRIGYRAEPDDYGYITLDGNRWRDLGGPQDPSGGELTEWPCQRDSDVAGCSGTSTVEDEGLFCASAQGHCGATSGAERETRAYMNHRMARAVMALKLLTGRDAANVVLPFRPEPYPLTTEADGDEGDGQELRGWRWAISANNDVLQLRGGRDFSLGDGVVYHVEEDDSGAAISRREEADFEVDGSTGCVDGDGGDGWLWTHFGSGGFSDRQRIYVPCEHDSEFMGGGNAQVSPANYLQPDLWLPNHATQAVVFRSAAGTADAAAGIFSDLWAGMGSGRISAAPEPGSLGSLTAVLSGSWRGVIAMDADCRRHGGHWDCESRQEVEDATEFTSYWTTGNNESNRYNDIRLFDGGVRADDFLDGLELACEVMADDFENPSVFEPSVCGDWDALASGSLSNLRQAQRLMQCMAHEIEQRGEAQVFANLPQDAIDAIRGPTVPPGTRGQQIAILATQLNTLARYPEEIATQLQAAGLILNRARIANSRNETRQDLNGLEQRSTQMREMMSCLASAGRATGQVAGAGLAAGAAGGFIVAAIADCANSTAQIVFSHQRENLQNRLSDLDNEDAINLVTSQLADAVANLKRLATEAENAQISLRGALATLESQRASAMREVTEALTTYGNPSAVATLQRRTFNTNHARYLEAQKRAIRTAWLARRALEQRIGRNLSDMTDELPLVDPPSKWADQLCVMSGLNYQQISRDYQLPGEDNFAREFVGDYVRRLGAVFDSYSVAHPFVTGDDTAIVSLRDDVVHARQWCEGPVRNLLAFSSDLNLSVDPDYVAPPASPDGTVLLRSGPPVWRRDGCVPYQVTIDDGTGTMVSVDRYGGCLGFSRLAVDDAVVAGSPEFGTPTAWAIRFGGQSSIHPGQSSYPTSGDATLAQRVYLATGTYRLSWRGNSSDVDPRTAVSVQDELGNPISMARMTTGYSDQGGWPVYYLFFSVGTDQEVDIVIGPGASNPTAASPMELRIAALMLENVTAELGTTTAAVVPTSTEHELHPFAYVETRQAAIASLPICEDTDGSVFRSRWRRGCTTLCAGGGEGCEDGRRECFWELPFNISQLDLEHGGQLARSGFANGNYNYRWSTVSANVVGTAIRDCEASDSPSTCYGSGFVPISLYHDGGFVVRNQWGELYDAPLFPGRLEHARALNAERFLTNPLSSADRALVEPYTRYEMRGRPLAGRYRMRVWDQDGVRFDRVEDIQLVLSYRYWTRLD